MVSPPLPCDREEDEETIELRALVSEYDDLLELCGVTRLSAEDVHQLDQLYATLLLMEEEYWQGEAPVSGLIVETLRDLMDIDFPMIRFELGLLPGQTYYEN